MPPFRIHQTRNRPERILIRLMQGRYIIPAVAAVAVAAPAAVSQPVISPETKKTTISLKQIKQIVTLLQQSEHKNLSKMLSPELRNLLTLDEDKVDDIEEEQHDVPDVPDEDDDVLIIDLE